MGPGMGGPEQEKAMTLNESLSDETRNRLAQELQNNDRLVKLLTAMKPEMKNNPDRQALASGLIDSEQGSGLTDKVFGAKMDMVRFINENISVSSGGPQAVKEKQWQYKQAMEGLFSALGMMQPQEEYRILTGRLRQNRLVTPENQSLYDLMEQRKQELEQDYGIQGTQ